MTPDKVFGYGGRYHRWRIAGRLGYRRPLREWIILEVMRKTRFLR